jgi:hypothetical protein
MPPESEQSAVMEQATAPDAAPNAPAGSKLPSAFSLFKPSWAAVKLNIVTFILLALIPAVLYFAIAALVLSMDKNSTGSLGSGAITAFAIVGLIVLLLATIFGPAIAYIQLKSVSGTKVTIGEALKSGLHFALRFLGLYIIMGLVIGIGFLLLIVPGLFMLRRYILAPYFLIDKDLGIMEAMNQSAEASKKYSSALWGLIGVSILISLPGIIPVIGALASAILGIAYYCAPAVRYKEVTTGVPSVATQ